MIVWDLEVDGRNEISVCHQRIPKRPPNACTQPAVPQRQWRDSPGIEPQVPKTFFQSQGQGHQKKVDQAEEKTFREERFHTCGHDRDRSRESTRWFRHATSCKKVTVHAGIQRVRGQRRRKWEPLKGTGAAKSLHNFERCTMYGNIRGLSIIADEPCALKLPGLCGALPALCERIEKAPKQPKGSQSPKSQSTGCQPGDARGENGKTIPYKLTQGASCNSLPGHARVFGLGSRKVSAESALFQAGPKPEETDCDNDATPDALPHNFSFNHKAWA